MNAATLPFARVTIKPENWPEVKARVWFFERDAAPAVSAYLTRHEIAHDLAYVPAVPADGFLTGEHEFSAALHDARDRLLGKLRRLVQSRPGFEWQSYDSAASYRADQRMAARQRADALALLDYVAARPAFYPVLDLVEPLRRGGRLVLEASGALFYDAGQYYPTEYRAAVARYLADLVWQAATTAERARGTPSPGAAVRRWARSQFGRGIAARYFR